MAHIFVLYGGSNKQDIDTVQTQIKTKVDNYATVDYVGSGYSLQEKDVEDHIYFHRDGVAKNFKKWLATNKSKFGIKKLDLLSDEQFEKLQKD